MSKKPFISLRVLHLACMDLNVSSNVVRLYNTSARENACDIPDLIFICILLISRQPARVCAVKYVYVVMFPKYYDNVVDAVFSSFSLPLSFLTLSLSLFLILSLSLSL